MVNSVWSQPVAERYLLHEKLSGKSSLPTASDSRRSRRKRVGNESARLKRLRCRLSSGVILTTGSALAANVTC